MCVLCIVFAVCEPTQSCKTRVRRWIRGRPGYLFSWLTLGL